MGLWIRQRPAWTSRGLIHDSDRGTNIERFATPSRSPKPRPFAYVGSRGDSYDNAMAVAPKPLNVLMFGPGLSVAELADLGVRRISIGGALARTAWGAVLRAAEEIKNGSFAGLADGAPGKLLNGIFGDFPAQPTK